MAARPRAWPCPSPCTCSLGSPSWPLNRASLLHAAPISACCSPVRAALRPWLSSAVESLRAHLCSESPAFLSLSVPSQLPRASSRVQPRRELSASPGLLFTSAAPKRPCSLHFPWTRHRLPVPSHGRAQRPLPSPGAGPCLSSLRPARSWPHLWCRPVVMCPCADFLCCSAALAARRAPWRLPWPPRRALRCSPCARRSPSSPYARIPPSCVRAYMCAPCFYCFLCAQPCPYVRHGRSPASRPGFCRASLRPP